MQDVRRILGSAGLYPKTKLSSSARPRIGLTFHPADIFSGPMGNAPDAVKRLVDHFDQNRKVFLSGDYKEEQLRAEFLNPLFTAFGWDMDNKQGLSETLSQVIHEETIKAGLTAVGVEAILML